MLWYVSKSITFYDATFINLKTNVVTPVREISVEYQLVVASPLGWAGEWLAVSICQCHRQFTIAITGTDRLLLMKERQYLSDLFEIAATVKRCVHCMRMVLSCCWVNQASAYPVPSVPLYVGQWTSLPWGGGVRVWALRPLSPMFIQCVFKVVHYTTASLSGKMIALRLKKTLSNKSKALFMIFTVIMYPSCTRYTKLRLSAILVVYFRSTDI